MTLPAVQKRHLTTSPVYRVSGVTKRFVTPDHQVFSALRDVTLDIAPGSFISLIGPSGCGKSTLLHMMAGLYRPSAGEIQFQGSSLRRVNTAAGYITQRDTLLPWQTVERNVGIGLSIRGIGDRTSRRDRVAESLELVGLSAFAHHYPSQLSGGMKKRTMLARSLAYDPQVLLMDEPFAALDAQMRMDLQDHLLNIWEMTGKTIVLVTHDLDEALLLSDELIIFGTNPGRVIERLVVPFERPRDIFGLRSLPEYGELWRHTWSKLSAAR